ncbi:MAG: sugar transferase [Acidimicrobiia bacterium]
MRPTHLRLALIGTDVACGALAWTTAYAIPTTRLGARGISVPQVILWLAALVVTLVLVNGAQHLYQARVCGVPALVYLRVARTAGVMALAAIPLARSVGGEFTLRRAALGGVLSVVAVSAGRMQFEDWLRSARRSGKHCRPVIVIAGPGADARACIEVLRDHPELGFTVFGTVGEARTAIEGVPYLGSRSELDPVLRRTNVRSVMVAADAATGGARDQLCNDLLRRGVHVQYVGGVPGLAVDRLRLVPLAHTPTLYLERRVLSRTQQVAKRTLDLTLASLGLVVLAPVMAGIALAIWWNDRGPVFFRQERIGLGGSPFAVVKFRTMVPDAEQQLARVRQQNERSGPLFKVHNDPRRTRVGRVLEATSLDELPQLLNVVRGEMSLVGPRPALAREVAAFDDELLERHAVLPGITGLWQLEARENPSFGAYRRLDLFYVQNWSLGLDLAILAGTVHAVGARMVRKVTA